MNLSRRFLCAAALAAVLALGLAGTALADIRTWTGGAADPTKWDEADNWDAGVPGTSDTAVFPKGAEITALGGLSLLMS